MKFIDFLLAVLWLSVGFLWLSIEHWGALAASWGAAIAHARLLTKDQR